MTGLLMFYVFFSSRRRHTRLVSDWSSDVCSSDLLMRTTAASLAPGPAKVLVRTEVSYCSVIQRLEAMAGEASSFPRFAVRFAPSGANANQSFSVWMRGDGAAMGRW